MNGTAAGEGPLDRSLPRAPSPARGRRPPRLARAATPLAPPALASPNPVLFGGTVVVQGTLSGTNNGGRTVVLQANSFPFTAGFQNLGNPLVTHPDGSFSFPVLGMSVVSQFRVVTTTKPAVISPV